MALSGCVGCAVMPLVPAVCDRLGLANVFFAGEMLYAVLLAAVDAKGKSAGVHDDLDHCAVRLAYQVLRLSVRVP